METSSTIKNPAFDSGTAYFKRLGAPIGALATAPGGPVGVVRVSAKNLKFLEELTGPLPEAGTFKYRPLEVFDPNEKKRFVIDRALILYFKAPHSFTGEDVVEIQLHGVASVLDAVLEDCFRLGATQALPGEFSFRSVLNSKMSLESAEGIQSAFAIEGLGPYWAAKLLGVRNSGQAGVKEKLSESLKALVALRGRIEAAIDFPEAESEQGAEILSALNRIEFAERELSALLSSFSNFTANAKEFSVAIVGQANAGKSTLLNILSGGKKSLVSALPGTTRDVVESRILLGSGQWIRILDTAGLRQNLNTSFDIHSELEREGMELGLEVAAQSSALIWVRSLESAEDKFTLKSIESLDRPVIEVYSHQDKAGSKHPRGFDFVGEAKGAREFIELELSKLVRTKSKQSNFEKKSESEAEILISQRQKSLIELSLKELNYARACLKGERPIEVASEHVRSAEDLLHKAVGSEAGEAYIGEIFSQFCLGK